MSAPRTPVTPVPRGHGIVLDPATRLADEGHLLLGGRPTRVVRLSAPKVSMLLCWMAGATPAAPEARALAAHLVAAGLAHPAPPPPRTAGAAHLESPGPDEGRALAGSQPEGAASCGPPSVPVEASGSDGPGADRALGAAHQGSGIGGGPGQAFGLDEVPHEGRPAGAAHRGNTGPDDGRVSGDMQVEAAASGGPSVPGEVPGSAGAPEAGRTPGMPQSGGHGWASEEGDSGGDDVLVLVPVGVCPEPGWLAPALAHLDDPRVGAVVPSAFVDEQDRGDTGPLRAGLAALLTRLTLPEALGASGGCADGHAVEHTCDDPPRRVPALVVRRSALLAPGAAPPAPEADTAHLPPAGVLSRTLPPTLPGALVASGWSVRHEPRSRVRVEPLRGVGAYLSASFELGADAGERAAGPRVSWVGMAALALALAGRPAGGACLALAGYTTAAAAHRLPPATAVRAVGACASDDARALVRAAEQGWAPVAGALVLRHPVAAAAVVASAALTGRSTPARSAAVAAGAVARTVGTWWGAWRARSAAALVPRVHTPLAARRPSRC
ncbi:hypothetical protein [Nocardiopsis coralli]|uniref:hypothetical protein n=1 Tax=Nocardiopsis coralli TaxID=2772213 RepID=UPI001F437963|nr:hypothetical protein [Nocardiopsis coralli]